MPILAELLSPEGEGAATTDEETEEAGMLYEVRVEARATDGVVSEVVAEVAAAAEGKFTAVTTLIEPAVIESTVTEDVETPAAKATDVCTELLNEASGGAG